jgi:hypothetical protein
MISFSILCAQIDIVLVEKKTAKNNDESILLKYNEFYRFLAFKIIIYLLKKKLSWGCHRGLF